MTRFARFVLRTLRGEWYAMVVDPVRRLMRRGVSGLLLAFVAAFGVIFFHAIAQHPRGETVVRLVGGVQADLPLWQALLRTPVSLYVPALDLPVWAGITQLFLAFALAELTLGRGRTLFISYATTLAGTLTVRVMLAMGPGWWGFGLPPEVGHVLDTGPSAAVVGLFTYLSVVRRAPVVFFLTGGSMVVESVLKPNLAGREHLIAIATALVLALLDERAWRRPGRRATAPVGTDAPAPGVRPGHPPGPAADARPLQATTDAPQPLRPAAATGNPGGPAGAGKPTARPETTESAASPHAADAGRAVLPPVVVGPVDTPPMAGAGRPERLTTATPDTADEKRPGTPPVVVGPSGAPHAADVGQPGIPPAVDTPADTPHAADVGQPGIPPVVDTPADTPHATDVGQPGIPPAVVGSPDLSHAADVEQPESAPALRPEPAKANALRTEPVAAGGPRTEPVAAHASRGDRPAADSWQPDRTTAGAGLPDRAAAGAGAGAGRADRPSANTGRIERPAAGARRAARPVAGAGQPEEPVVPGETGASRVAEPPALTRRSSFRH